MELKTGLTFEKKIKVVYEQTATAKGSGGVLVFSTPDLILLMEDVCYQLAQPYLAENESTVGTIVNIKHLAATPVGMEVLAKGELIEVDRKRLVFNVEAYDEKDKIGEGVHERFIINKDKFMDKVEEKLK